MIQSNRIEGGLIDRDNRVQFTFNGKTFKGFAGDTLASALLANGQRLVGRSFKYHRPRGIFTSGSEEPNALVELGRGAFKDPNTRATVAELFDGLQAHSQNHRGSLKHDLMAVTDLFSPFLTAGFYYKTFMWPRAFWERFYEPIIRNSAGLGRLSVRDDPDIYDKGFLHCDVLVIGAGPAGLCAALVAGRAGAQVILADEDFRMGGRLLSETYHVDGKVGSEWVEQTLIELGAMDNVRLMPRSSVYGAYDHGIYGVLERVRDHLATSGGKPRQILWKVYSKHAILCAGSTERPIAFANNDRPGIMLAGAVRAYANRWGVGAGKRVSIFTNNDDGWRTASDLAAKNVDVAAIIDSRDQAPLEAPTGTLVVMGAGVLNTKGRHGLQSITLTNGQVIKTDCLAVSGGWNPNIHLTCHHGGRPKWHDKIAAFVPAGEIPPNMAVAGAASGTMTLGAILAEGNSIAIDVIGKLSLTASDHRAPKAEDEDARVSPYWHVKQSRGRAWLDLQNDVTVKDIKQAHQEGFRSVELMKHYPRHGHGPGKNCEYSCFGGDGGMHGQEHSRNRHNHFPSTLYPRPDCSICRSCKRQGFPPNAADPGPQLGCTTRCCLYRSRRLAASTMVPSRKGNPLAPDS